MVAAPLDVQLTVVTSTTRQAMGLSVGRAARLFTYCALGVIAFQVALVGGAPWGALTQGGRTPGALGTSGRAIAAASVVLLASMIVVVRARAGLLRSPRAARLASFVWLVVGYCAVGVLANAVTPSAAERALWLPVVAIMLATSLHVARAGRPSVPRPRA